MSLVVAPVDVQAAAPDQNVGAQIADQLAALISDPRYQVLDRTSLSRVMKENDFIQFVQNASKDSAGNLASAIGADCILTSRLTGHPGAYQLFASLLDRKTLIARNALTESATIDFQQVSIQNLLAQLELARPPAANLPVAPGFVAIAAPERNDLQNAVNDQAPFRVRIQVDQKNADGSPKSDFIEGETIRFLVEADADCYITIITFDGEGTQRLILPNGLQSGGEELVRKGEPTLIPPIHSHFKFKASKPFGPTFVKVVASIGKPIDLKGITPEVLKSKVFPVLPRPAIGEKGIVVVPVAAQPGTSPAGSLHDLQGATWATDDLALSVHSP